MSENLCFSEHLGFDKGLTDEIIYLLGQLSAALLDSKELQSLLTGLDLIALWPHLPEVWLEVVNVERLKLWERWRVEVPGNNLRYEAEIRKLVLSSENSEVGDDEHLGELIWVLEVDSELHH